MRARAARASARARRLIGARCRKALILTREHTRDKIVDSSGYHLSFGQITRLCADHVLFASKLPGSRARV